MKDAARLAAYFAATILAAAVVAPILYWAAQWFVAHGLFPFLARYDFETFFHRALLIAAALLLWPFLRVTNVRSMADLRLAPNSSGGRDVFAGILLSAIPLLCCGALLIAFDVYSFRHSFAWARFGKMLAASVTVPFIEETLFRGIVLGVLLRTGRQYMSILATSAIFSVIHFLKAPERTSTVVTWTSGLNSIAYSFEQFGDATMLISAFATLFLIGWILADARVLTRSLWLSIGLHAGWIFGNGTFSRVARQEMLVLPWLGKNLLVGIVPLGVACLTWVLMRIWLKYDRASKV
ncbi:MAG TPA: CPBP family intramembrane glutamic endopeptidase [Candidatus Udaeobacter sp.]|nr:CPBP family intramembrane glutamic endopeptidase [Candidatus Udaeobacter sp.]